MLFVRKFREQLIWTLIAVVMLAAFYFSLRVYTTDLEHPFVLIRLMVVAHLLRLYFAVKYDWTRHAPKEVALLSIAAVFAVWVAIYVRPLTLGILRAMEVDPELSDTLVNYQEYINVMHNNVFGISAFFLTAYFISIKLVRWIGTKIPALTYPRSSYEAFGAFYEAANGLVSDEGLQVIETKAREILAETKGIYKVPTAKFIL